MADVITRFKLETTQFDSKLRDASKNITNLTKHFALAGKDFDKFAQSSVEQARALGKIESGATNLKDRLKDLVGAYNDVARQYNTLTKEQQNGDYGKALAGSLQELQGRIRNTKAEMNAVPGVLDQLASKFTINIDAVKLFNKGMQAASAVLDVVKDAVFQSETNIDEWGRTVEGAKGAYDVFLNTLNSGNWSNFFSNLEKAIQGGRDLYDALDRLGSIKSNNQAAIAIVQAEIQQLRVLKQQGKDVDEQIKQATQRLKGLQGQSIRAGKSAGRTEIVNTLRNEVGARNTTGVQIDDRLLKAAADRALKEGQSYFDGMRHVMQQYESNAKYQSTHVNYNGPGGMPTTEQGFDMSKLTSEQQKQYLIAKAITEGETHIQQGIGIYAQAVWEGAQSAREEFRGNRYALTGNGPSSDGSQKEVVSQMKLPELGTVTLSTTESMKELQAQLAAYKQQLANATNVFDYGEAQQGIEQTQKRIEAQPLALSVGLDTDSVVEMQENLNATIEEMRANIKPLEVDVETGNGKAAVKTANDTNKAWQAAASAISSAGSAMQSMEDPAAKVAGIVMQAIASVALGFAQASAEDGKLGVFGWIAAVAAGLATMTATIASIKSATKGGFAEGGIVPGNSWSGDNLRTSDYGINSGELILNKAQQYSIAQQLEDGERQVGSTQPFVNAELIYLGLNNYLRRTGRGELITTRR